RLAHYARFVTGDLIWNYGGIERVSLLTALLDGIAEPLTVEASVVWRRKFLPVAEVEVDRSATVRRQVQKIVRRGFSSALIWVYSRRLTANDVVVNAVLDIR